MEPVTLAVASLAVLMLLLSFGVPIVFCFSGALAFMSIVGGVTMKGMMMWGLQQILSPTLLCIPLFIYAGYLFGGLDIVQRNLKLLIVAIIVLSVLPAVIEVWRARRGRRKTK